MAPKRRRTESGAKAAGKSSYPFLYRRWERTTYPKDQYYKRFYPRTAESAAEYGSSYREASEEQKAQRKMDHMIGRGKFRLGRSIRNQLGRQGARRFGSTVGSLMDAASGNALSALSGSGMYAGAGRSLGGRGMYNAPFSNDSETLKHGQLFFKPHFSGDGVEHDEGGLVISNQEFVSNVYGNPSGSSFESVTYGINPGMANVFPMLSQFAANFERYELVQCAFHFETQLDSGIIQSSTGQVGDVLMYSHADPKNPDLQNTSEFQMNGGAVSRVTHGLVSGVECDPEQMSGLPNAGINYVRLGPKDDVSEYDQAKFQVAVSNTPTDLAGQVIGKLYVSYTVRLIKPRLMSLMSRNVLQDIFVQKDTTDYNPGAFGLSPMGNGILSSLSTNRIGCTVASTYKDSTGVTTTVVTFPDWLQGLIEIDMSSMTPFSSSDPNQAVEVGATAGYPRALDNIGTTGQVSLVNWSMLADGSTLPTGVYSDGEFNYDDILAGPYEGGPKGALFCHVKRFVRVSPALTTDNSIVFEFRPLGDIATTNDPVDVRVTVTVINDYSAVGTQSITAVASIA